MGILRRAFHRIPLTLKMVTLTIAVGLAVWAASDLIQTEALKSIFQAQLAERLRQQAFEDRLRFDRHIKSYRQAAKVFASQKQFLDYIENKNWFRDADAQIRYHRRPPPWFPARSVLRSLARPRYALLLDSRGRVVEAYQGQEKPPPLALLQPTNRLLRLSHNQVNMTSLEGVPFLITSESVTGLRKVTLMLASPIDEEFLVASQGTAHGRLVALVTGERPRILMSSNLNLLPAGALLETLRDRYLVTGQEFFGYGSSEMAIKFASFVSTSEVESLTRSVISKGRQQHAITVFILILSFTFIMFWITKRIVRLTHRVTDFSEVVLGGHPEKPEHGDQMDILEDRFQRLTEEVVSSNAALRKARDELEVRVEERTAELRKLLSTLDALVQHLPEGVILLDADNRIALANPIGEKYLETLSGVGVGEVLKDIQGRPLSDFLVSPPTLMWHEIEVPGPPKAVFEAAARSIGADGGLVLVLKDVTEESELKDRVHQQERLASVGRLAAGIAHDFNNILSVIIGYSEMLQEMELPSEADRGVELIHESGQKATALVRQMLDFSRLSASEMKVLDLGPFMKEFSEFIRRTIPENIIISLKYGPERYIVVADATKMQQVLTNLAVNARDVMPNGGELSFGLTRLTLKPGEKPPLHEMPPGDWIALSVTDTGEGIAPEVLPRIFEPFFSTKAVGRGTGLGLSQVYGIVKQHEGFIDVESKPGKGSVFTIYLPAVAALAEAPVAEEVPEVPAGHGETIMLVEDNKAVLDLGRSILSELGYVLITATNGKEALDAFRKHREEIDLVITDIVMPEMGGEELSREIKNLNPSVKIIALSGYPLGDKRKELLDAGIEHWISKPVKKQALAQAVRKALNKKGLNFDL